MTASNDFGPGPDVPTVCAERVTTDGAQTHTGFLVLTEYFRAGRLGAVSEVLLMGAWTVFGFFGLDVLVIWWAFRVNFRRAAATEEITVTPSELRVRRVSHRGHVVEWVLNPLWVQLDQQVHAEFGIERLYLVSRGRRVSVGAFSAPTKKPVLPRPCWPHCRAPNGVSPITRCRETLVGNRVAPKPRPSYTEPHDEPRHE